MQLSTMRIYYALEQKEMLSLFLTFFSTFQSAICFDLLFRLLWFICQLLSAIWLYKFFFTAFECLHFVIYCPGTFCGKSCILLPFVFCIAVLFSVSVSPCLQLSVVRFELQRVAAKMVHTLLLMLLNQTLADTDSRVDDLCVCVVRN